MKKTASDFDWWIEDDILKIVDLNLGRMSVTNDIENVLTFINMELEKTLVTLKLECTLDNPTTKLKIHYQDSDGNWDSIKPFWKEMRCTSVIFQPGIK